MHPMLRHSDEHGGLNEREVRVYRELAPKSLQTPTVPCYDVAWDYEPPRWHVLLLDVSRSHDHGPQPLATAQREFLMPSHARDLAPPFPLSTTGTAPTCSGRPWKDREWEVRHRH